MKNIDLKNIKLIIWDLDETFWIGTLSEGDVQIINAYAELIVKLTNKGIINSICSKNDYELVKETFAKKNLNNIFDLFVFNSINWEPKGIRIKQIIENMQLRDTNVLFIDDNIMNLKEATFYCPNIKTITPNLIDEEIILQLDNIKKDDSTHSRLKQYKLLEQKNITKNSYSSNEEFLYSSNIQCEIKNDCMNNIDRILELINRTNQLNYTKIRIEKDELVKLLSDNTYENRYIEVTDSFGEYGIVGFYSLDKENNQLKHFLFSCRILSMGIEQYVYSLLDYPKLSINGEIASELKIGERCNWINNNKGNITTHNFSKTEKNNLSYNILIKGPCDLKRVAQYLKNSTNITLEVMSRYKGMPTDNNLRVLNIANSFKLTDKQKEQVTKLAPFIAEGLYNQTIFNKKYDVIIYSLLLDYHSIVLEQKETKQLISWFDRPDFTNKKTWNFYQKFTNDNYIYDKTNLEKLANDYNYCGYMSVEQLIQNLNFIMENVNPDTKWIFILGSEIEPNEEQLKNKQFQLRYERHKEFNPHLKSFIDSKSNATYIDLTQLVKTNKNYTIHTDHFKLEVYYKLSQMITEKVNTILNTEQKSISSISYIQYLKIYIKEILLFIFNKFKNK